MSRCRKNITLLLAAAFLLFPAVNRAEEGPLKEALVEKLHLEWTEVEGAKNYEIQIRTEQGETVFSKVTDKNRIELDLKPGEYYHRVGVVNKFGKVSAWTPWKPYKVVSTAKPAVRNITAGEVNAEKGTQTLIVEGENIDDKTDIKITNNQENIPVITRKIRDDGKVEVTVAYKEAPRENFSLLAENPGGLHNTKSQQLTVKDDGIRISSSSRRIPGLKEPARIGAPPEDSQPEETDSEQKESVGNRWMVLIPGLPAMYRGSYLTGSSWFLAFSGLAGTGASATASMQASKAAFASDPFILMTQDPVFYSLTAPYLTNTESKLAVQMIAGSNFNSYRKTYNQQNAVRQGAAGAALVAYTAHLFTETSDTWSWTTPIPGADQLRSGHWLSGSLLMAGFTGAVSYGFSSASEAAGITAAQNSDFLFRLFNDPLLYSQSGNLIPDQSILENLSYVSYMQHNAMKTQYQGKLAAMNAGFGAAAAIYLVHIIDAAVLRPRSAETEAAAAFLMQENRKRKNTGQKAEEGRLIGFTAYPSDGGIEGRLIFSF